MRYALPTSIDEAASRRHLPFHTFKAGKARALGHALVVTRAACMAATGPRGGRLSGLGGLGGASAPALDWHLRWLCSFRFQGSSRQYLRKRLPRIDGYVCGRSDGRR